MGRKKDKPQPTPTRQNDEGILDLNEAQVKKAFEHLVKRKLTVEQGEKLKNFNNLDRVLSEYMDCCIIMGYDTKGEGVVRFNCNNNLQHDALVNLLQKVYASQIGPAGHNNPF